MEVLRGGPFALKIGKNVAEMERKVADLYGKKLGLMCNSGSSAIYLALELLDLPKGSEVITSPLTFSTDVSPIVRGGWVPVFVDVEPDTYNVDVSRIEELITDKTKAMLFPNLAGNAPDWDAIRDIADRHGLKVIEDSCDSLEPPCGAPRPAAEPTSPSPVSLWHTSSPVRVTAAWCASTTKSCGTRA